MSMVPVVLTVFLAALLWAVVIYLKLPLGIAVTATAALVVAWAGALAWRLWKARRAAAEIEEALRSQAEAQTQGARPDQQAEIEAMQAEFAKAVQALKGSKLARGGRNALALLPWYLIIGPPGGGKSTALRASGLKFPYLSKRGGVRGVGGTRNCEWWLTNEAVLLDTAGRYATEEEDHEEWMSFLDTLARARPRKPVNGLLVAIPLVDVGAETEEGAGELGRRLRERVDEVMARLRLVLPVYVVLTKCDLLPGFVEVFGNLPKTARAQVWGYTVPAGGTADQAESFGERFDELVAAAEERSLLRLGEERQLAARERIYELPQQLGASKLLLAAFLEALFAESVYQDTPILRGVYLTSGTQEGRVVDRVMAAMASAFGIRAPAPEAEPVVEAKSYFLRDLFARVIFPDQHLAFRNREALRRDAIRRWVLAGAAVGVAALGLYFPLRAFFWNRELIRSTGDRVAAVEGKLRAGRGPPPLAELEPLRERLALLVELSEHGPPFGLDLGMYRGNELLPRVRRLYAATTRRMLLDPVFRRDVEDMDALARRLEGSDAAPAPGEHAHFYDALKLHLLLTAPRATTEPRLGDAEEAFIGAQVAARWSAGGATTADPTLPRLIEKNARLFAKLLSGDPTLALPRHEDLVRRVRRVLARLPLSTLAVEKLVAEVEDKGYQLSLAAMLGGPVASLRATSGVRGAYTRRAYEELLKGRLDDPTSLLELWVLAGDGVEGGAGAAGELERLRSRYYEGYIAEWRRFLDSVTIERGTGGALALLQDLTRGEPPPLARLFRAVGYNTRLGGLAGAAARAGEGLLGRVRTALDPQGRASGVISRAAPERAERLYGPRDVERAFAGFVEFGHAPEAPLPAAGGPAPPQRNLPVDVYQEQLAFVRDALQASTEGGDPGALVGRVAQARTRIQSLLDGQEVGWRPRLASLLWPPVELATSSSVVEASRGAAEKWCSVVALPFQRNLAARYPFARGGDDAALADVAEFFRAGSGVLWAFYNESLRTAVQRSGDGFQLARQLGGSGFRPELLPFLRDAQQVTAALFPAGAAEPTVAFSVNIRPTPRVAAVLLDVDGQRAEYRNGPEEWQRLVWPGQGKTPGASLRVRLDDGREETIQRDGEWGLFRLLEAGRLEGEPRGRNFSMAFDLPALNTAVVIDFQSARSESPFVGARRGGRPRLLEPLRGGAAVPLAIGRGVAGCK